MKMFTTITPVYRNLVDKWLLRSVATVEPGIPVHVEIFDEIQGNGDFGTEGFKAHNRRKAEAISRWISQNTGDVIFVCDADVVFMRPFSSRVVDELGEHDIAISPETLEDGYNIGQVAIRCSERASEFYAEIAERLADDVWDQELVNTLLPLSALRAKRLSPLFCNTLIWRNINTQTRSRLYSYHANDSASTDTLTSVELKQQLIDRALESRADSL